MTTRSLEARLASAARGTNVDRYTGTAAVRFQCPNGCGPMVRNTREFLAQSPDLPTHYCPSPDNSCWGRAWIRNGVVEKITRTQAELRAHQATRAQGAAA